MDTLATVCAVLLAALILCIAIQCFRATRIAQELAHQQSTEEQRLWAYVRGGAL